jgi:hypothetical protein
VVIYSTTQTQSKDSPITQVVLEVTGSGTDSIGLLHLIGPLQLIGLECELLFGSVGVNSNWTANIVEAHGFFTDIKVPFGIAGTVWYSLFQTFLFDKRS